MAENTTSDDSNKENDCVAILASLSADSAHAPSPIRVADANVLRTPPPTPGKRQGTPTTVISSIPCRFPPGNAIEIVCSFDRFLFFCVCGVSGGHWWRTQCRVVGCQRHFVASNGHRMCRVHWSERCSPQKRSSDTEVIDLEEPTSKRPTVATIAASVLQKSEEQKTAPLTVGQRWAIVAFTSISMPISLIASTLKIDERTVRFWQKKLEEGDYSMQRKPSTGRPESLDFDTKADIVATVVEWPFQTPAMVRAELDLTVSNRTIDRVLITAGLYGRRAKQTYPYTIGQKQVRLAFANRYVQQPDSFWDTVYFTDESSFQLGLTKNLVYVRRPSGKAFEMEEEYVWKNETKVKSGTIKFFGGFCSTGVSKLFYYEKMTGAQMVEIIEENIVPETQRLFPNGGWLILHDNDKRWRCKRVYAHAHNRGITQINDEIWPAYSPDLNPIENLWADLKSRVADRNPRGVDELLEFIEDEWNKTPLELLQKLARSMKTRLQMVIQKNGAKIAY